MASSSTLFAACSETPFPSEVSGHDSVDGKPSANRAAKENSTKGTRTEDNYSSAQRNGRFYGQYNHRVFIRSVPAFLGVSYMGVTFPPEKGRNRSEEHTSELQSHSDLVCRLLLEQKPAPSVPRTAPP